MGVTFAAIAPNKCCVTFYNVCIFKTLGHNIINVKEELPLKPKLNIFL